MRVVFRLGVRHKSVAATSLRVTLQKLKLIYEARYEAVQRLDGPKKAGRNTLASTVRVAAL